MTQSGNKTEMQREGKEEKGAVVRKREWMKAGLRNLLCCRQQEPCGFLCVV